MQPSTLSAAQIAEFKTRETKAIECLKATSQQWEAFTKEMQVIKQRELWRAKHQSWTAFVTFVGEEAGVKKRRFFEILRAEDTRLKLVQHAAPKVSKLAQKMSNRALLEAAKVPEADREEVLEQAAKHHAGKPPDAPAIAAAAKVRAATSGGVKPPKQLDTRGHEIPAPALPFWERRDEVQPFLTELSKIKTHIEKARRAGDALYSWIGTPAIDALQNAYTTIANAKLYAVCTRCQGWWDKMTGGGCSACHNTGLISKHQYEVCSPKEVKEIRERADRMQA